MGGFRAILYKDWDGVTNAKNPPHGDTRVVDVAILNNKYLINPSRITFSPLVIAEIDRLREQYALELAWSTTWNLNGTVLTLPELIGGLRGGRVLPIALNHHAKDKKEWTQWKADAIIEDQNRNPSPFIWLDDNAHAYWGKYVQKHTAAPSLLITTESSSGLTLTNLQAMESFLQTLK